jgi:hypothetical protein
MENFFLQYKNPLWQRKRLEIMKRDDFACQSCGDTETTLNVHHTCPYRKNTKIWEYEDHELITLCENCHQEISEYIDTCKLIITDTCSKSVSFAQEMTDLIQEMDAVDPAILSYFSNLMKAERKNGYKNVLEYWRTEKNKKTNTI